MQDLFENIDLTKFIESEESSSKVDDLETTTSKDEKKSVSKTTEEDSNEEETQEEGFLSKLTEEEIAQLDPYGEEENNSKGTPKETNIKAPDKKDNNHSSDTQLSSLAQHLFESGVLSYIEEEDLKEIKDEESFVKLFEKQIKSAELADLNEDQKEYLEALRNGVPQHTYSEKKYNASVYQNIKEEQIEASQELRAELIRRKCLAKGLSQAEANKYVERTLAVNEDVEEAIEAKQFLANFEKEQLTKQLEEAKQKRVQEEKKEADKLLELKSKVNQTSTIIEGVTINSQTKEKVYESITKPAKMIDEKPVNEVLAKYLEDDDFKVKLHTLYVVTKGFTTFDKFVKEAKTTASKTLSERIKSGQGSFSSAGNSPASSGGSSQRKLIDGLNDFLKG
jgi:hypothetical protein